MLYFTIMLTWYWKGEASVQAFHETAPDLTTAVNQAKKTCLEEAEDGDETIDDITVYFDTAYAGHIVPLDTEESRKLNLKDR
jgi:hypothetical protein